MDNFDTRKWFKKQYLEESMSDEEIHAIKRYEELTLDDKLKLAKIQAMMDREKSLREDEQFVGNDINANKLLNILTEYLPTSHYHQDKTLSYDEALNMVAEFVKFTGMDSTGEDFLNHIMDTEDL